MEQDLQNIITLDTPIKRGKDEIKEIILRKPNSGALRGASLTDLLQMDVAALERVLPRISEPSLLPQEVAALDPADLFQLGTAVASFLLPRAMRPQLSQISQIE